MSPHQIKQRTAKRKVFFRKWHRRIGFSASLFLFNLAITGILLNHYESLNLHKNYVQSNWLLDWYDVKHSTEIDCLSYSADKVCQLGSELYAVKNNPNKNTAVNFISADLGRLISVKKHHADVYLITDKNLLIFDENFQMIDRLSIFDEVYENVLSAVFTEDKLYLKTETQLFLFDDLLTENVSLDYQKLASTDEFIINVEESNHTKILNRLSDPLLLNQLSEKYRQRQISYLKVVQDLHSGQIFSVQGKLMTDLVGIIIMLLAISGFITWNRRKKQL